MRKRDLVEENRRLVSEVSYLRGRVEVLEGEGVRAVEHVRDIMVSFSSPAMPEPYMDTGEVDVEMEDGEDWTDQMAPRTMSDADMEALYRDWNDAPHIGDPGEGS